MRRATRCLFVEVWHGTEDKTGRSLRLFQCHAHTTHPNGLCYHHQPEVVERRKAERTRRKKEAERNQKLMERSEAMIALLQKLEPYAPDTMKAEIAGVLEGLNDY